jgi:uncharacterized RDD family membrane protein YckC
MSLGSSGFGADGPLNEMWYLQGDSEAQGPYRGHDIKAMIEAGSVDADSLVAKVGASQWTAVGDIPAFAAYVAGVRRPVQYAGFWIRLVAYVIDFILVYAMAFIGGLIVGFIIGIAASGTSNDQGVKELAQAAGALVGLAVGLFYFIYFPSGSWQATPGKRIVGIHLIRADGGRVTGLLALGRYLSYLISSLTLGIGFFMIGWNKEKKGLHDIICGTRVIYGKL